MAAESGSRHYLIVLQLDELTAKYVEIVKKGEYSDDERKEILNVATKTAERNPGQKVYVTQISDTFRVPEMEWVGFEFPVGYDHDDE